MATYKQRDNGAWQAVIRRKGFPVQSKTFEKKTDAEIWARKVESDLDRGIYIPANEAERTTLGDLIKEFVTDFAPHHYRQREDKKEAWRFQCDRLSEAMGTCVGWRRRLTSLQSKSVGMAGYGSKKTCTTPGHPGGPVSRRSKQNVVSVPLPLMTVRAVGA